jgi:hypothetical protein
MTRGLRRSWSRPTLGRALTASCTHRSWSRPTLGRALTARRSSTGALSGPTARCRATPPRSLTVATTEYSRSFTSPGQSRACGSPPTNDRCRSGKRSSVPPAPASGTSRLRPAERLRPRSPRPKTAKVSWGPGLSQGGARRSARSARAPGCCSRQSCSAMGRGRFSLSSVSRERARLADAALRHP